MRQRSLGVALTFVVILMMSSWAGEALVSSGVTTSPSPQGSLQQRLDELESRLEALTREVDALKSQKAICLCRESLEGMMPPPKEPKGYPLPYNGETYWVLPLAPAGGNP